MDRFVAFLRALNSHKVCNVGALTGFASIALIGGQHPLDALALAHLGAFGPIAKALIDAGAAISFYALPPSLAAAALGRPPTVPKGP